MFPTPDYVVSSPESLAKVLAKDLEEWSTQITILSGSWLEKSVADSGLVTLALTTYGDKVGIFSIEAVIVEALTTIGVKEIVSGPNQRGVGFRGKIYSYIFYRPAGEPT